MHPLRELILKHRIDAVVSSAWRQLHMLIWNDRPLAHKVWTQTPNPNVSFVSIESKMILILWSRDSRQLSDRSHSVNTTLARIIPKVPPLEKCPLEARVWQESSFPMKCLKGKANRVAIRIASSFTRFVSSFQVTNHIFLPQKPNSGIPLNP